MQTDEPSKPAEAQSFLTDELASCISCDLFEIYDTECVSKCPDNCQKWLRNFKECPMDKAANAALTGAEGVRVEGTVMQQTEGVNEMAVALDDDGLRLLRMNLEQGEYNGVDIMHAWLAIDELLELRSWKAKAFLAHANIDLDIEALDDGA